MSVQRKDQGHIFRVGIAVIAGFGVTVSAQETEEEATSAESVEEIIVVAPKPGGRKRVDDIYMDPVRARVLKDLQELEKDQEEYEWRTIKAVKSPPRIKWGYDPTDDYYLRNEISLKDDNFGGTKPATLFQVGF